MAEEHRLVWRKTILVAHRDDQWMSRKAHPCSCRSVVIARWLSVVSHSLVDTARYCGSEQNGMNSAGETVLKVNNKLFLLRTVPFVR